MAAIWNVIPKAIINAIQKADRLMDRQIAKVFMQRKLQLKDEDLSELTKSFKGAEGRTRSQTERVQKELQKVEEESKQEDESESDKDDIDDDLDSYDEKKLLQDELSKYQAILTNPKKLQIEQIKDVIVKIDEMYSAKFANSRFEQTISSPLVKTHFAELYNKQSSLTEPLKSLLVKFKEPLRKNLQDEISLLKKHRLALLSMPAYLGIKLNKEAKQLIDENIKNIEKEIIEKSKRLKNIDKEIEHQASQLAKNETFKELIKAQYQKSLASANPSSPPSAVRMGGNKGLHFAYASSSTSSQTSRTTPQLSSPASEQPQSEDRQKMKRPK